MTKKYWGLLNKPTSVLLFPFWAAFFFDLGALYKWQDIWIIPLPPTTKELLNHKSFLLEPTVFIHFFSPLSSAPRLLLVSAKKDIHFSMGATLRNEKYILYTRIYIFTAASRSDFRFPCWEEKEIVSTNKKIQEIKCLRTRCDRCWHCKALQGNIYDFRALKKKWIWTWK